MTKKKPARHRLDIYGAELVLAWNDDQWDRLLDKYDFLTASDRDSAGSTSLTLDTEDGHRPHIIVWVGLEQHNGNALDLVTTAAHEAAHVATMLLVHLGHTIRSEDEPHAYLVGWVTAWIIEQIEWKL